jgi:DNA-binding response OmpR family regulator
MQMITKPFSMENLATRIREMVESALPDVGGTRH